MAASGGCSVLEGAFARRGGRGLQRTTIGELEGSVWKGWGTGKRVNACAILLEPRLTTLDARV